MALAAQSAAQSKGSLNLSLARGHTAAPPAMHRSPCVPCSPVPSSQPQKQYTGFLGTSPAPCRHVLRASSSNNNVSNNASNSKKNVRVISTSCEPEHNNITGTGCYLLLLTNVTLFALDHLLHLQLVRQLLYLNHAHPTALQFLGHMFCHGSWQHLSNNLFLLLVFGKLVEETEGAWGLWAVYVLTGLGAALASHFIHAAGAGLQGKAIVSIGASGAIFGLFTVSILTRLSSWNFRRLLEAAILGQFVVNQVFDEVRHQLAGGLSAGGMRVSHLAHLGGAVAGVALVLLATRLGSMFEERKGH